MEQLTEKNKRGSFGSKFGVIAATAGSAIGLGNIWRFPYITGENGGAAFILMYVGFVLLIGIPVMLSELSIGRMTQKNPFGAFKLLQPKKKWWIIGVIGIASAFMINSFYCVIAGWTLEYLVKAITNQFHSKDATEISTMLNTFQTNSWRPLFWTVAFVALTGSVVLAGIEKGIEKSTKILMPLLFILLIILDIRALTLPNGSEGLTFLFKPDFSKINGTSVLMALGQAFFSLSIGMGTLITYGSYIKKTDNLGTSALAVAFSDTLVAILAGIAIFPAVFAFGISPAAGPDLVFLSLPNIFSQMAGGYVFAIFFFALLVVAALTSTISILEVVVAYFTEELKMKRKAATLVASIGIAVLGILCSLSLNKVPSLSIAGKTLFGHVEHISSNIFLPVGGLLIVIFVGWFFGKSVFKAELSSGGSFKVRYFPILYFLVKFIAPIAIAFVFLNGLGLIKF